ncbi:protein WHI4, partial [Tanacetum coccineum]
MVSTMAQFHLLTCRFLHHQEDSENEEQSKPDKNTSTKSLGSGHYGADRKQSACLTFSIVNLDPKCNEAELRPVLSKYPGFNSLTMCNRGAMRVAFADFKEVEQATEVMNALQGSMLPSSDRGSMHIKLSF